LAVVILVPSDFAFSIASMVPGSWMERFIGSFKNNVTMSGESEFMNPKTDVIGITGVISSIFPEIKEGDYAADATDLNFIFTQDPVTNKVGTYLTFVHNGKNMMDLWSMLEYTDKEIDLSKYTGSGTILDLLVALMGGSNLDATFSLNGDLTTEISVSDCGKAMQLQKEMAHARRNYADQATIEGYTQQLNELVSAKMTCDGVNQEIPMRLQTEKFGVDYWAMPAFNFADEKGYVPFTELLDKESVEYAINIVDHAAEPMAGAIITVRQLLQFVQTFMMQMRVSQAQAQATNK